MRVVKSICPMLFEKFQFSRTNGTNRAFCCIIWMLSSSFGRVNSYEATQFRIWAREVLKGLPSHCATLYSIVPKRTLYSVCA